MATGAAAHGITTTDTASGQVLDAFYPAPALGGEPTAIDGFDSPRTDALRGVTIAAILTSIDDLDAPPVDVPDAYLRLHLLSHRLVRPHEINLDGIFGVLPNVAWTSPRAGGDRAGRRGPARARSRPASTSGCTASTSSRG